MKTFQILGSHFLGAHIVCPAESEQFSPLQNRDAIAHRHNVDFDSDYRREEVIASVGGKHALFNAIQVLVDHGDEVILPVPYWVSFKDIVRYAGGNCVLLHADEEQGFRRVRLANGLTGWVPAAAVELVVPRGWSDQRRL